MLLTVLKSKIHRVKVTEANIDYIGSITIDEDLMEAANLFENEQVHVFNYRNGARLITYVIKGKRGSGVICMNGPAVFQIENGDMIIIVAYAQIELNQISKHKPTVIFPKEENKL